MAAAEAERGGWHLCRAPAVARSPVWTPVTRRERPDGAGRGRGDGPLGIHASPHGPAQPHPTDAERSEAQTSQLASALREVDVPHG